MATLKDLVKKEELLTGGHRLCPGCGASIVVRQVLLASKYPVVAGAATGCLEVATTIFPYTAWKIPWIHNAFENVAATISGVESAYRALRRRGRYDKEVKFIAFGGDGGTYDIGLQSLSGAMERGHNMLYVCYDNEAYMNTGVQRSSATPRGAHTTTAPAGRVLQGKEQYRKDLTRAIAAHGIPYAAQSTMGLWNDLVTKVEKALAVEGPTFINVLSSCQLGWAHDESQSVFLSKLAADTCFWPLYEVDHGVWRLTYRPREKKPLAEWLKPQGRFRHLFRPDNAGLLDELQADVDRRWEELLKQCQEK